MKKFLSLLALPFLALALFFPADVWSEIPGNRASLNAANNLGDVANASTSITNILPTQSGQSGKALVSNGTVAAWQTVGAGSVTSVATGAGLSGGTITTTGTVIATANTLTTGLPYVIDGGGSAITTSTCSYTSGQLCVLEVPFACTISKVDMLTDQTGSVVIELAKTTYANYAPGTHPVSGDKITSSTPPTISSAAKSTDSTLTSWTTSISAGDIIGYSVTSATTVTRVLVTIWCIKP